MSRCRRRRCATRWRCSSRRATWSSPTSAGRIPTDKGYRFFVDHLAAPGRLDAATSAEVGAFFSAAHGRLEEMLLRTSNLLSHLTSYAAVVVGPKTEAATVRSIQLVGLSNQHATVVVVLGNGTVENQIVELPAETTDATVDAASAHLASERSLVPTMASAEIGPSVTPPSTPCAASAFDAIRQVSGDDHVYVGGASWMAGAFDAVEVVRDVLHTLEQQFIVVSLVRDIVDRGCRWRSGSSTASSRCRPAPWSCRRSSSVASISARSACSGRPA